MIPRISRALFLTHGMGLLRIRAVNSITRPFLSTPDGRKLQQEDELKGLNDEIAELKCELLAAVDSGERTAIRNQIAATTYRFAAIKNEITALLAIQQGTVASPIAVIFSNPVNRNLFAQSVDGC